MALSRQSSIFNKNLNTRYIMVPDNQSASRRLFFICTGLQGMITLASIILFYKKNHDIRSKIHKLEQLKNDFIQFQEKLNTIKQQQEQLRKEIDNSLQELYQKNEELYQQKLTANSENNAKKKILGNLGLRSKL